MRVLVVHAGNMWGGLERTLETLAQAERLCPALQPTFALAFDGAFAANLRTLGVPPVILGEVRLRRPDLALLARRRLAALLDELRPDVVLIPAAWAHAVFASVVRRARIPLALWIHDILTGTPWLERLAARVQPDLLICNSAFTLERARQVFPAAAARVLYCPLTFDTPAPARAPVRTALHTTDAAVVFTNVARMERYKGQSLLIDALTRLPLDPPWACWIVGGAQRPAEQAYMDSLQRQIAAAGLGSRVTLLGHRRDVPALLAASDVYCHPNTDAEPFGLAIVEALHAGLPVVASRLGGPAEIVTDACGRLVDAGNADQLADALTWCTREPQARQQLGLAGPARARQLCDAEARLADLADSLSALQGRAA